MFIERAAISERFKKWGAKATQLVASPVRLLWSKEVQTPQALAPITPFPSKEIDMDLQLAPYRAVQIQPEKPIIARSEQLWINDKNSIVSGVGEKGYGVRVSLASKDQQTQTLKDQRERYRRQYRYHFREKGEEHVVTQDKLKEFQKATIGLFERLKAERESRAEEKLAQQPEASFEKGTEKIIKMVDWKAGRRRFTQLAAAAVLAVGSHVYSVVSDIYSTSGQEANASAYAQESDLQTNWEDYLSK